MQEVDPGKIAVENIFWTEGAPCGKYTVSVINYTAASEVGFTLLVSGGGEKQIGGTMQQDMRSFDSILTTPNDAKVAAEPGDDPIKRPGQKVCEFEFSSTKEPIRWLWTMPPQSAAAQEKAGALLKPSGEPRADDSDSDLGLTDDSFDGSHVDVPPLSAAPRAPAPMPPR